MSGNFNNNINSFNTLNLLNLINVMNVSNVSISNHLTRDDVEILAWISPLDPRIRHHDLQARRLDNVGDWILQTEQYQSWCDITRQGNSDHVALFCYGDPGVGKTYISSLAIDALCDQAKGKDITVACFYFDFAAQKEQSLASVLGALLKQVVQGLNEIPDAIRKAYEDQKKVIGGRGLRLPEIIGMLQTILSSRRAFLCIDALDECASRDRLKLLSSLRDILRKSPGTQLFLTGRPHVREETEKCFGENVAIIPITPNREDVIRYINSVLDEDPTPEEMDSALKEDIVKIISEKVSEIFLLVSLNMDAILQETTIYHRRKRLNAITDGFGLGEAYSATLERIKAQGSERAKLGMVTLMWICYSERPLQSDELCHAVAVGIGSTDLDSNNVPSVRTLLGCCQGLFFVDKESSTVRLIHFTLREYFSTHPDFFGKAHSTIAETCLNYLNSEQVKKLSANPSPNLQGAPFLRYSSRYWGTHAKIQLSDRAKLLALELFDRYDDHISARSLVAQVRDYPRLKAVSPFTGLHCASFFGIVEIATALIEMKGCDINQRDFGGVTPLIWAAENGHEGMVTLLLGEKYIEPDLPNEQARTPLSCAAENGHEGVVKLLLGREGVDPNRAEDDSGQTALSWAAENGHEGVVRLLLGDSHINPDKPDKWGQTPLLLAAENGYERVVTLLLRREGVNPNSSDDDGQTSLSRAAESGHEGVVEVLLGWEGLDPNRPDDNEQTPLLWAAKNGHERIVRLLLERKGVNPDDLDKWTRTPISWAANNGHEGVVSLLLGAEGVNPEKPDKWGRTPLSWAAESGHGEVVRLLLEKGSVMPDEQDKSGRTPLSWAAESGYEGVVRLLLEREGVDPDKPDKWRRTPFLRACESGHEGVVRLLQGRETLDTGNPKKQSRTPSPNSTSKKHKRSA